jgi:hypothetical protein
MNLKLADPDAQPTHDGVRLENGLTRGDDEWLVSEITPV